MLNATNDFNTALSEVETLINYSRRNARDMFKYGLFNKSSIVLLCTKFETFIESFLEEYAFEVCSSCNSSTIENILLNRITDVLLSDLEKCKGNLTRRQPVLEKLAELHSPTPTSLIGLPTNPKFKYGKHGQKEVERLFRTFGFSGFCDTIKAEGFYGQFNGLLNIRNNIIHEDATPSLTHRDVENYKNLLFNFSTKADIEASTKLSAL